MIPRFRLIEEIEAWGTLVALVGGEHHGAEVLLVPRDRVLPGNAPRTTPRRRLRAEPDGPRLTRAKTSVERATALLESLLDHDQLRAWRRDHRFWVQTPYGDVQLGRLGNILFHRNDGARHELCVVPVGANELPLPDVWTNLVLILQAAPERFFQVANWSSGSRYTGWTTLRTMAPRDP